MASLKLINAEKVFPSGSIALHNINLQAEDKEFLVVAGGEGCGKSTLLRVVAGLEDLTGGEILIDGKPAGDEEVKERDVAMVFRNSVIKPTLNVYDNLAYGLKLRKASGALIEHRVKAVAEILGLTEVLYRLPKTLTAAQKQRVAIGRAVIREPRLYLFDEPLAGLDAKLKTELLNVIINLRARMNGTFVYATKNVNEAMTAGTRIAVLKDGILQQIDTPSNLYDYPANAYVAFFIGSPTINFIHNAKIVKTDGGVFVKRGKVEIALSESVLNRFEGIDEYAAAQREVIIGIRPEDARLCGEGIAADTGKTENGYTACEIDGNPFTVKEGNGGKVKINADRLYLFDEITHLTLLKRDGGYCETGFADADYKPLTLQEEEEIKNKAKPAKPQKRK